MKTPQQIKNEVEKGCGQEFNETSHNYDRCGMFYNHFSRKKDKWEFKDGCELCYECKDKLSILTEYDKSIKEMIDEFVKSNRGVEISIFSMNKLKELLSKIGDNSYNSQESSRVEKQDEMPDYETTNEVTTGNCIQTTIDNSSIHPDGSPKGLCKCGHIKDMHWGNDVEGYTFCNYNCDCKKYEELGGER